MLAPSQARIADGPQARDAPCRNAASMMEGRLSTRKNDYSCSGPNRRSARVVRMLMATCLIVVALALASPPDTNSASRIVDNAVSITVSGEVDVVLVDPKGRRDEYRGAVSVSTFPGCWRSPQAGGRESVGEAATQPTTNIFDLEGSAPGTYRLYLSGRERSKVTLVVIRRVHGKPPCALERHTEVKAGTRQCWSLSWNDWSRTDSCWVSATFLPRHRGKALRN